MNDVRWVISEMAAGLSGSSAVGFLLDSSHWGAARLGYSADFWRMVLGDLRKRVLKGDPWLDSVHQVSKNWQIKKSELVKFLLSHNLLQRMKSGKVTDNDINRLFAKLSGSQEEFDAYLAKNPIEKLKKRKK